MKHAEELLSDESFQRWLEGNADKREIKQWQFWLNESNENKELFEKAQQIWFGADISTINPPGINSAWEKLKHRTILKETESETAKGKSRANILPFKSRSRKVIWQRYIPLTAAASLLFIIFLKFDLFTKKEDQQFSLLQTGYGQRVEMTLTDGSKIILNANSSLKYPAKWTNETKRRFELTGEAYFQVTNQLAGPQDDFIVSTTDGFIRVMGTEFAVYERGSGTRVALVEGKVEAGSYDIVKNDKKNLPKTILKPGQVLQFESGSDLLTPKNVNILPYTTWFEKRLVFHFTPLSEIVQRIEETFDIKVKVTDPELLKVTFSGSVENTSLEVIANSLAKGLGISVDQDSLNIIFKK